MNGNGHHNLSQDKHPISSNQLSYDFISDTRPRLIMPELEVQPMEIETHTSIDKFMDLSLYSSMYNNTFDFMLSFEPKEEFSMYEIRQNQNSNQKDTNLDFKEVPEGLEWFLDKEDLELIHF